MRNRNIGTHPAIGIRPIIDARRGALGVRQSLEEQTMNMAKSAAKLFAENLRYTDGTPVRVVIADTTIGRVGETAACAEKFKREQVAVTLSVTPCWCYGSETMDMTRTRSRRSGASTAPSAPARSILPPSLPRTRRRDCRRSVFTGMTSSPQPQPKFRQT